MQYTLLQIIRSSLNLELRVLSQKIISMIFQEIRSRILSYRSHIFRRDKLQTDAQFMHLAEEIRTHNCLIDKIPDKTVACIILYGL